MELLVTRLELIHSSVIVYQALMELIANFKVTYACQTHAKTVLLVHRVKEVTDVLVLQTLQVKIVNLLNYVLQLRTLVKTMHNVVKI